jgi:pyridoxal phosphate enzyme (YggS family)
MIGHLQRNKVKYLMGRVELIHSVDSLRLAQEIDKESAKAGIVTPILLEVNMAREASKGGVMPEDAQRLAAEVAKFPHLSVRGLMTIAPMVERAEENRVHFRNLRNLSIDISSKNIDNVAMCELSMGMTGDYEIAVEEGATLIRVGTGIFGERDYTKTAGI